MKFSLNKITKEKIIVLKINRTDETKGEKKGINDKLVNVSRSLLNTFPDRIGN